MKERGRNVRQGCAWDDEMIFLVPLLLEKGPFGGSSGEKDGSRVSNGDRKEDKCRVDQSSRRPPSLLFLSAFLTLTHTVSTAAYSATHFLYPFYICLSRRRPSLFSPLYGAPVVNVVVLTDYSPGKSCNTY